MPNTAWSRKSSAIVLPDEIDDVLGSQVETLATVVNGMNHLHMLPYDYVLIMGFGPIGYLFAQFAKNIAAKVAVTEIDPFRIECGQTMRPDRLESERGGCREENHRFHLRAQGGYRH